MGTVTKHDYSEKHLRVLVLIEIIQTKPIKSNRTAIQEAASSSAFDNQHSQINKRVPKYKLDIFRNIFYMSL